MAYKRLGNITELIIDNQGRLQLVSETAGDIMKRLESVDELLVNDGKLVVSLEAGPSAPVDWADIEDIPDWISDSTAYGQSLTGAANAAGARTLLGLGSLATLSTITSTQITDGTIVNADISATAGIALSKLANTPNQLFTLVANGAIDGFPPLVGTTLTTDYLGWGIHWASAGLSLTDIRLIPEFGGATPYTVTVPGKTGTLALVSDIVAVAANKTLARVDIGSFQNVTAAATITVPPNATASYLTVGTQIDFFQAGAGAITFAAGAGVTIISKGDNLATAEAGDAATLKKTATDTWALIINGGA